MVFLREASIDDRDLLFDWANDPTVRKNSFSTDPIAYPEHVRWFGRVLDDADTLQYILVDGNVPVGQIRLGLSGQEATISYSIAPEHRGKGYGHLILRLVAAEVSESHPEILTLNALVKEENLASVALFESEGYELVDSSHFSDAVSGDCDSHGDARATSCVRTYKRKVAQ